MKKTKAAKKVKVTWKEFTYTVKRSEYQCPVCRTIFQNTLDNKTTRFLCDGCDQELIST